MDFVQTPECQPPKPQITHPPLTCERGQYTNHANVQSSFLYYCKYVIHLRVSITENIIQ